MGRSRVIWAPPPLDRTQSGPRATRSDPRGPKSVSRRTRIEPRAAKSGQERPKSGQERPKEPQEWPKEPPRTPQERPGVSFLIVFHRFYNDFVNITLLNKYNEQIRNKRVKIKKNTKQYVEDV